MRIIAFSDVHEDFWRVPEALAQAGPVDAAIIAGDLTTNGTPADVERAFAQWQSLAPRWFAVSGNMDSPAIDRALGKLGVLLDGCCQRFGSAAFFGCSAAPISIGTPYEISEAEIASRIQRGYQEARGADWLVFVPHSPPLGTLDLTGTGISAGSRSVRDFIAREQPHVVICGHIHEARGQDQIGRSLVVNCGPAARGHYAIIELDERGYRATLI